MQVAVKKKNERQNQLNPTSAEPENMNHSANQESSDAAHVVPHGKEDRKTDSQDSVKGGTVDKKMKSSESCSKDEEQKKAEGNFETKESKL